LFFLLSNVLGDPLNVPILLSKTCCISSLVFLVFFWVSFDFFSLTS
jgi:hypothetical protein